MAKIWTFKDVYDLVRHDEVQFAQFSTFLCAPLEKVFTASQINATGKDVIRDLLYREIKHVPFVKYDGEPEQLFFDFIVGTGELTQEYKDRFIGLEKYVVYSDMETHFQNNKADLLKYAFNNGKTVTDSETYYNPVNGMASRLAGKQKVTVDGEQSRNKDLKQILDEASDVMSPLMKFITNIYSHCMVYWGGEYATEIL